MDHYIHFPLIEGNLDTGFPSAACCLEFYAPLRRQPRWCMDPANMPPQLQNQVPRKRPLRHYELRAIDLMRDFILNRQELLNSGLTVCLEYLQTQQFEFPKLLYNHDRQQEELDFHYVFSSKYERAQQYLEYHCPRRLLDPRRKKVTQKGFDEVCYWLAIAELIARGIEPKLDVDEQISLASAGNDIFYWLTIEELKILGFGTRPVSDERLAPGSEVKRPLAVSRAPPSPERVDPDESDEYADESTDSESSGSEYDPGEVKSYACRSNQGQDRDFVDSEHEPRTIAKSSDGRRSRKVTQTDPFSCFRPDCEEILYIHQADFFSHLKSRHGGQLDEGKKYSCGFDFCEESFTRAHDVVRHVESHAGLMTKCDKCADTFTRRDAYLRHDRDIHANSVSVKESKKRKRH